MVKTGSEFVGILMNEPRSSEGIFTEVSQP
jgi:hypothetical protein